MAVSLVWSTPDIDGTILEICRVSSGKQDRVNRGLLQYLMRNGHVSPFEMANVCLEIVTERDIARQILRHRSFSFQEFSQRYANPLEKLPVPEVRSARTQHPTSRQHSLETNDEALSHSWHAVQKRAISVAHELYQEALTLGIARELARSLLPEGLTKTRLYVNGTMRSWIHYLKQRLDTTTQYEHRIVASQVIVVLRTVAPETISAFFGTDDDET
jgi:thymidylate synthase (FAD)